MSYSCNPHGQFEARLAERSDTPRTDKAADYTAPEKLHRVAKELERELAAAITFIKELNATKYQHGRQYRSRCGQFLSSLTKP